MDVSIINFGTLWSLVSRKEKNRWPNLKDMKMNLITHIFEMFINKDDCPHTRNPNDKLPVHFPEFMYSHGERRKCIICSAGGDQRKTSHVCMGCKLASGDNIPFCVQKERNCWKKFHEQPSQTRKLVAEEYEKHLMAAEGQMASKRKWTS